MNENNAIQRYVPIAPAVERWRPAAEISYDRAATEGVLDLHAYWRVLCNRRTTVLATLLAVFNLVLLGTLLQTPIYRASGLLEIGKENPDIVPVEALFKIDAVSDEYLQTQFEVLKSASLAERVINRLHLEQLEEFNPAPPWWSWKRWISQPPRPPEQVFQAVTQTFQRLLTAQPIKGTRLVRVSFDSEDPQRAAQIVNSLLSDYIEMRLQASQKSSTYLTRQLANTKVKLEKTESELRSYARKNGLLFLETNKGDSENIVNERLRQVQEELTRAQAARYEKESLYRLVQKGDYGSLPGAVNNKLLQDLTVRLADLKREHAMLAATFTADYPKVKQVKGQTEEIEAMIARENRRAAEQISNDYLAAVKREDLLRRAFQEQQALANGVADRSAAYDNLKREADANKQLYETLLAKLKEAGVSAGLKAGNVSVVDVATSPLVPDRPNLMVNLALAVMLGLGLGVGAAFLQEHLDTTLKTPEEVNRFLDLPAMAMIPAVETLGGGRVRGRRVLDVKRLLARGGSEPGSPQAAHWYRIDTGGRQQSILAEAFGCLRTSVMLSTPNPVPRSLLISSSQPGEGKTTVSVNLAISLAQLGQRVLLIDTDMRRPCVHRALRLRNRTGLVNYLSGKEDWPALVQSSRMPGLGVITSGSPPANPAELLSSWRMRDLLSQALVDYDFAVLDSPALLINAADGRILAPLVDGVMLVVRSGATPRDAVLRARAQARNVIGVILNQMDTRALPDYYRGYYGGYYRPDTKPPEISDEGKTLETAEARG